MKPKIMHLGTGTLNSLGENFIALIPACCGTVYQRRYEEDSTRKSSSFHGVLSLSVWRGRRTPASVQDFPSVLQALYSKPWPVGFGTLPP